MENIIEAKSLARLFDGFKAADSIDFSLRQGEIFSFLGPNGAGKTTTIRMLTGILIPDRGTALIDGVDMAREPIKAKESIGVIPEVGNIYLDLSAMQNIFLAGKFYGLDKVTIKKRADRLLKMLELEGKGKLAVGAFSKDQKQRGSIAAAIVHEPKVLFLDEHTSGLDVGSQRAQRA
ncbi:MAG: ABC transporter ATP-binding protein [Actinomycetota bacterium]